MPSGSRAPSRPRARASRRRSRARPRPSASPAASRIAHAGGELAGACVDDSAGPDAGAGGGADGPDGTPVACTDLGVAFTSPTTGRCDARVEGSLTSVEAGTLCATSALIPAILSGPVGIREFLIGLRDDLVEDTFVWASGEPFAYASWGGTEPDDATAAGDEDCVWSLAGTNALWFDIPCGVDPHAFVCERAAP